MDQERAAAKVQKLFPPLPATEEEANHHCQQDDSHCHGHCNDGNLALIIGCCNCWEKTQKKELVVKGTTCIKMSAASQQVIDGGLNNSPASSWGYLMMSVFRKAFEGGNINSPNINQKSNAH